MRLRVRAALGVLTAAAISTCAAIAAPDDGDAVRATLANGLRVVIVPDHLAPVVTTEISYLAGSDEAPAGFPGTAHALEHMMFRGARGLDQAQLAILGARMGGNYNAQTTETATQYFYTAAATDLPVMLRIEALRMNGALLRQEDWNRERGAIEQEVSRDLSSPAYVYLAQLQAALFAGTPCEHDALGTRPSFDRTDVKLLRAFYERWYAPNDAVLVIAGDVDPATALGEVHAAFDAVPRKALPARATVQPRPQPARTLSLPTTYPVAFATLAWRMPSLTSHDFAAADIMSDVLGSRRYALYGLVPEGRALATQFLYRAKRDIGTGVALAAYPRGGDPAPVLADLRRVIATAAKGLPAELIDAAKKKEIAQLAFAPNSIQGLATTWSQALVFQDLASPSAIAAAYARVTKADVDRVAREILDPAHEVTALLTPDESGRAVASGGFGGTETFANPPDHPVKLPDWARQEVGALDLPPPAAVPVETTLANGLRLIVHPTDVSDTVTVIGEVRAEPALEEPPGREGVADLAEQLYEYGTASLDRFAFRRAADDIAADIDLGQSFSLEVPAASFDRGIGLLADGELHPAFPDAAFATAQRQLAAETAGSLRSPDWLFGQAKLEAILPPGDKQLRHATPASVLALTPADLRRYVETAWRPDLTTIVVVGHVAPEHAREIIAHAFGGWQSHGARPDVDLPSVPPSGRSTRDVADPATLQTEVHLAESLPVTAHSPDRALVDLGNEILGAGFSSRLYRDLRVKNGLVYNVASHIDWERTRTAWTITYGLDAANAERARALAIADIVDLQTHLVGADELDLARANALRRLPLGRASEDAIATQDLLLAELGLPLDDPDRRARTILAADAAQLRAALARSLRAGDLAEITKGPPAAPLRARR